jgi:GTPase SAR1 family protein
MHHHTDIHTIVGLYFAQIAVLVAFQALHFNPVSLCKIRLLHYRILGIRTAVLSIITFWTRAKPKERRTMGNSNAKPNTSRPVDTTRAKPKEQRTMGNSSARPNTSRPVDTTPAKRKEQRTMANLNVKPNTSRPVNTTRAKPKEQRTMGNSSAKPNTSRPVDNPKEQTRAKPPKEQRTMGNFNAKPNTSRPVDTTRKSIDSYKQQVLNRSRDPDIIYGPNANVDDFYNDAVIHTERAQHEFSKEMKRHEIYDVYTEVPETSIRLENIKDLFYPNKDTKGNFPCSILAIGRPGIGKTVLTEKLLRDWANETDDCYSDKIAFFFEFRWFNNNKLENLSLKTFLQFGTGLSDEEFESIYEEITKEPQKAILIFDGLDEFHGNPINCLDQSRIIPNDPNTGTSAMNLFIKLILGDLLKGATVVVTSRPTADYQFFSRLDFDRNVEIIGFLSDKIEEYVSRFCDINNTSDLKTTIWNHIKSSSELLNLCYIPGNCLMVCVTLSGCLSEPVNETSALPTTLTELYQTTIDHFEKYHHRNASRNSMAHEALKQLQRLAFLGMESGQLVFNQVLFDEQMKTCGLLNSLSNPIFPLQIQLCFIHLTIQEFLAARHVTETFAPPEIKKFISDHVESGKWHLVLQFIAGLLGKKMFDREYKDCIFAYAESLEATHGKIELNYNEVFVMTCLREVDDEEIVKDVCETTALNDVVHLHGGSHIVSPSEWAARKFVCKHMKNLELNSYANELHVAVCYEEPVDHGEYYPFNIKSRSPLLLHGIQNAKL